MVKSLKKILKDYKAGKGFDLGDYILALENEMPLNSVLAMTDKHKKKTTYAVIIDSEPAGFTILQFNKDRKHLISTMINQFFDNDDDIANLCALYDNNDIKVIPFDSPFAAMNYFMSMYENCGDATLRAI